jgi:hypothetical protein
MASPSEPKSSASQADLDRRTVPAANSHKQLQPLFVRFASQPTAKQVP